MTLKHRGTNRIPRQVWISPLYDIACWIAAVIVASYLRYQVISKVNVHSNRLVIEIAVCTVFQLAIGTRFIYRSRWRIGSFEEVVNVVGVVACGGVALLIVSSMWTRSEFSYGAVVVATLFAIIFSVGGRIMYRLTKRNLGEVSSEITSARAIIFGAGDAGIQVVDALLASQTTLIPVALLDDDPKKRHLRVRSISVVGDRERIGDTARKFNAEVLVISIATLDAANIADLANRAKDAGLEVRILPPLSELFAGRVSVGDIRRLTVEDLLGRREVDTDIEQINDILTGKRVLITGAGGSIGSELCRQIFNFSPSSMVLLDRDESALHEVQLSLEGRALLDSRHLVVCDIRDAEALHRVFEEHHPQVVFHAAALKHLSLLEMWPAEALKTNVWGTLNILEAAHTHGVEIFVNISTDKAADPSSVLGYTKRLAERVTASFHTGRYLSVRFGNVLSSRGSFIPAFRKQIELGGPITVTHPEVTRYFMTISEAVQLTLQAAAVGDSGEVLVLEMGEPVRIYDVAQQLATESTKPIDIVFTGLRPGEKLHETLRGASETEIRKVHPSITSCWVPPIDAAICLSIPADEDCDFVREALRLVVVEAQDDLEVVDSNS